MATRAESQLYPISTNDGEAIPLEIVRPLSLLKATIAANTGTTLTIPGDFSVVAIYSDINAVLDFNGLGGFPTLSFYESALFIPAQTMITAILPSTGEVTISPITAEESGILTIQELERWAGIAQSRSLVKR